MAKRKKSKALSRKSPLAPFMDKILEQLILPEVQAACGAGVRNMRDLWGKFRKNTGSNVSLQTFQQWMSDLNIELSQPKIQIQLPDTPSSMGAVMASVAPQIRDVIDRAVQAPLKEETLEEAARQEIRVRPDGQLELFPDNVKSVPHEDSAPPVLPGTNPFLTQNAFGRVGGLLPPG